MSPQVSEFDLTNKTALVTGSARGIGKALARGLIQAGATVIVHGRDRTQAEQVAVELDPTGKYAKATSFDVSDPNQVELGMQQIENDLGTPDIVVNNAGVQRRGAIQDFSDQDWQDLINTNLTGVFNVTRRVAPGMISRGSGKLIQVGSVQSLLGRPSIAPYTATKGGIAMFTKGLCADLAQYGIQANAIAPGYFATELTENLVSDPAFSQWVKTRTPDGRWGDVQDLVGPLIFLASDASRFVNGQTIYVDGGMTAVV